jgi:hypothetical protein
MLKPPAPSTRTISKSPRRLPGISATRAWRGCVGSKPEEVADEDMSKATARRRNDDAGGADGPPGIDPAVRAL